MPVLNACQNESYFGSFILNKIFTVFLAHVSSYKLCLNKELLVIAYRVVENVCNR